MMTDDGDKKTVNGKLVFVATAGNGNLTDLLSSLDILCVDAAMWTMYVVSDWSLFCRSMRCEKSSQFAREAGKLLVRTRRRARQTMPAPIACMLASHNTTTGPDCIEPFMHNLNTTPALSQKSRRSNPPPM
jgi:hypothetical protein